ncbi:Aste57867_1657 [Aphanomyces stellatus]|uniref:Aste57867_1657 protein n=1 Tax=Aphanomyces stellatus TaxID=120398 RepID=A0A485K5T9_9STRA|nr:hypothetical protein As57867_001655 [Aphanomyces stellatus]VFT78869.1 Aste57867_1657 [Aphanomyces stellatus]
MSPPVRSLSYAAKSGDLALVRILIEEHGHNFHEHDAFNATPFQHACLHGHPQIAQYLLSLYARDTIDIPPVELEVCKRGCTNPELRKYLKGEQTIDEAVLNDNETKRANELTIWDAAKEGHMGRLRDLAKWGYLRNGPKHMVVRDDDDHTALYYACTHNHPTAVAMLVAEFKAVLTSPEFDAEVQVCSATATSSAVRGLLDGSLTLQEIVAPKNAKKKPANVAATPVESTLASTGHETPTWHRQVHNDRDGHDRVDIRLDPKQVPRRGVGRQSRCVARDRPPGARQQPATSPAVAQARAPTHTIQHLGSKTSFGYSLRPTHELWGWGVVARRTFQGTVTLEWNGWPSYALMTSTLAILLQEVVGYDVTFFETGDGDAASQRMSSERKGTITPTHINAEIWAAQKFQVLQVYANETSYVNNGARGTERLLTCGHDRPR